MSRLDTRGFLDGALRGFEAMDRHQARQENIERTRRLDERTQQLDERNEQRYQDRQDRLAAQDEKEESRYQHQLAREKKQDDLHQQQVTASIDSNKATKEFNTWKLKREQTQAWLTDNAPLIATANDRYIESGGKDVDPILDSEFVKGGPNDIRTYTGEMFQAATDLETVLPKVIRGEVNINDPAFIQPLGKMYENRVKVGIGDKDETGKVIDNKELTHVTNVADIDPQTAGDQPGMVLGVTVTYADGTKVIKPITENRSTSSDDRPLVIPLESAMQNITQRLTKAKALNMQISHPAQYAKMLKDQEAYKEAVYQNEKERVKTLNDEFSKQPDDAVRANTDELNQAAALRYNIPTKKSEPGGGLDDWVGNDEGKLAFLDAAKAKGFDTASVPVDKLNRIYVDWAKTQQKGQVANIIRQESTQYSQTK